MPFSKLKQIEARDALSAKPFACDEPTPSWIYFGAETAKREFLENCPAAWRLAVEQAIDSLNAALPEDAGTSNGLRRNQAIASLKFDFSGSRAALVVDGQGYHSHGGKRRPIWTALNDPSVAGIARKLSARTAAVCRTCGGTKPHTHASQHCTRCCTTQRVAALLGRELRNTIKACTPSAHARHEHLKHVRRLASLDRAKVTISVARLQELLINAAEIGRAAGTC